MQIVIDINEDVFTRLFDNGTEDYAIVNDDLFAIAKSIRKGTPLEKVIEDIKTEIKSISTTIPMTDGVTAYGFKIKDANDYRESVLETIDRHIKGDVE